MSLENGVAAAMFAFALALAAFALGLTRAVRGVDLRSMAEEPPGLHPGTPAPNVELPSTSGGSVRLPRTQRPTILVFASATCDDCHAVAPIVDQVRSEMGSQLDVHIIVAGDDIAVRRFAQATGVAAPLLTDPAGMAARNYGVRRVPLGVFVGANGRIAQSSTLTATNAGKLLAEFVRDATL